MYVGRMVAIARTHDGRTAALYRVSSRSFPNRTVRIRDESAIVVPRQGFQDDIFKNPYIGYTCLRIVGGTAVVSNGSHTDPIADKLAAGTPPRDALAEVLLALDYEKDAYNTPRIAAAIGRQGEQGVLGIVRKDGLHVRQIAVPAGSIFYLATYELDDVDPRRHDAFDAADAAAGARFVIEAGPFAMMTHPVVSVCALEKPSGFEIAAHTPPESDAQPGRSPAGGRSAG